MYEIGDTVPLTTQVRDAVGTPANAGSMNLAVTLPDGTAGTVTNPVTGTAGAYSYPYLFTVAGAHTITWTATGANAGVYTDTLYVESDQAIVSLAEAKAYLRITRTADDELLRGLILTASSLCESAEGTGQVWRRRTVMNEVHTSGGTIIPYLRPVQALTAISIDGSAGVPSDYTVESWRITGGSWSSAAVSITYVVGSNVIPRAVRDGTLEMVRHLYAMHRGGSNLPRQEEPDYTLQAGYLIPNRVAMAWRAFQDSGLG
jgi:hypothetical protein